MDNEAQEQETQGQQAAGAEGSKETAPASTLAGGADSNAQTQQENQPVAYDFTGIVPEGMSYDENAAKEFGALANELGLSAEQANKLAAYGMGYMGNNVNAVEQARQAQVAKWADDTRSQLGGNFDKTMSLVAAGRDAVAAKVPGLVNMLNETGVGNRIEVIQLLAEVGKIYSEDHGVGANAQPAKAKSIYGNTDFSRY